MPSDSYSEENGEESASSTSSSSSSYSSSRSSSSSSASTNTFESASRYYPGLRDPAFEEVRGPIQSIVTAQPAEDTLPYWVALVAALRSQDKQTSLDMMMSFDHKQRSSYERVCRRIKESDEFIELLLGILHTHALGNATATPANNNNNSANANNTAGADGNSVPPAAAASASQSASDDVFSLACIAAYFIMHGTAEPLDDQSTISDALSLAQSGPACRRIVGFAALCAKLNDQVDDAPLNDAIGLGITKLLFSRLHELAGGRRHQRCSQSRARSPRRGIDSPTLRSSQLRSPLMPSSPLTQTPSSPLCGFKRPRQESDSSLPIGARVARGPEWRHGSQGGGDNSAGGTVRAIDGSFVVVEWDAAPGRLFRYDASSRPEVVAYDVAMTQSKVDQLNIDLQYEEAVVVMSTMEIVCGTTQNVVSLCLQYGTLELLLSLAKHPHTVLSCVATQVLRALLNHKKLVSAFVELHGVDHILDVLETAPTVAHRCSCFLALERIAFIDFGLVLSFYGGSSSPTVIRLLSVVERNLTSDVSSVQEGICAFYSSVIAIPSVLEAFDSGDALLTMLDIVRKGLNTPDDSFTSPLTNTGLAVMAALTTYVRAHLATALRPVFRKLRNLGHFTCSNQDRAFSHDAMREAVMLVSSHSEFFRASVDQAALLITPERVPRLQRLLEVNFHVLMLEVIWRSLSVERYDILFCALSVLEGLCALPFARLAIAEVEVSGAARPGIGVLLSVLELSASEIDKRKISTVCSSMAANCVLLLLVPAYLQTAAGAVSFDRICTLLRMCDGIRMVSNLIQKNVIREDSEMEQKAGAVAIAIFSRLCAHPNTCQFLSGLGIAKKIIDYVVEAFPRMDIQHLLSSQDEGARSRPTGWHPWDDEELRCNLTALLQSTHGSLGAHGSQGVRDVPSQSVSQEMTEAVQRKSVLSHTRIAYTEQSMLALIAEHLRQLGYDRSVKTLLDEAHLSDSTDPPETFERSQTLDSIATAYLRQQVENCAIPISTLPHFDLRRPQSSLPALYSATRNSHRYTNVLSRLSERKTTCRMDSLCTSMHRNLLHRNYNLFMDIRGEDNALQAECVTFMDEGRTICVGTSDGGLAMFDAYSDADILRPVEQHVIIDDYAALSVTTCVDSSVVAITCADGSSRICARNQLPTVGFRIDNVNHVWLSVDGKWGLTTDLDHAAQKAILYDITRQSEVSHFVEAHHSMTPNDRNIACLDRNSMLVLNDAVLWDVRACQQPICRFDKIQERSRSLFHPDSTLVLVDSNVWDTRNRKVLFSCPQLSEAMPCFTNRGDVLFSWNLSSEIHVLSSTTFDLISTIQMHRTPQSFCLDTWSGHRFAVDEDSTVKVYEAGGPADEQHGDNRSEVAVESDVGEWSQEEDDEGDSDDPGLEDPLVGDSYSSDEGEDEEEGDANDGGDAASVHGSAHHSVSST